VLVLGFYFYSSCYHCWSPLSMLLPFFFSSLYLTLNLVGWLQQRVALLREAMSTPVLMATVEQTLEEVEGHFGVVSGLPVVDSTRRCVGVVVKSDCARASHGVSSPSSFFICFTHNSCRLAGRRTKRKKDTPTTHTRIQVATSIYHHLVC
jgi:CBS-domain-containing membrane protein